jgi:hypothetical protein
VMITIAHPREWPGRKVRSATKRLYIGVYTIVVKNDRMPLGLLTANVTVLSQRGVTIERVYFPERPANTFARSPRGILCVLSALISCELQNTGDTFSISVRGSESIVIFISLHGKSMNPEAVLFTTSMSGIFGMTIVSSLIVRRIFEVPVSIFFVLGKKYWREKVTIRA